MKSRIIPTIPETVLSYNIGGKADALEKAAASLGIKHAVIPTDRAGETVGFLAGYKGFAPNGTANEVDGECVIFSGISSKRLDMLLKAMRTERLDIPLKAVVTAYNQKMTVTELLEELSKEHNAIARAKK